MPTEAAPPPSVSRPRHINDLTNSSYVLSICLCSSGGYPCHEKARRAGEAEAGDLRPVSTAFAYLAKVSPAQRNADKDRPVGGGGSHTFAAPQQGIVGPSRGESRWKPSPSAKAMLDGRAPLAVKRQRTGPRLGRSKQAEMSRWADDPTTRNRALEMNK